MSGGTETRGQILPAQEAPDIGYVLPAYDFAGNLKTPKSVGVSRGGGLGDIINAGKGIAYYADVIGFGGPSTSFTQGMPFDKMGINFFTKTGMQCSNGADMWLYFEGIPRGDALGATLQRAMNEMGYPALRGLAPGILEDTKSALNPKNVLQAAFGNVYPECEQVTKQVGDDRGLIKDPTSGEEWVKGEVQYVNGRPQQTRWIQKRKPNGDLVYLERDQWEKAPKTQNPDGSSKSKAGFSDLGRSSLAVAIVLGCLAVILVKAK